MSVSPGGAAPPEIRVWGLWHWPNPYVLVAAAWGLHGSAPAFAPLQLYETQRAAVRLGDTELCWMDAGSRLGLGKVQRELTAVSSRCTLPRPSGDLVSQRQAQVPACAHQATASCR